MPDPSEQVRDVCNLIRGKIQRQLEGTDNLNNDFHEKWRYMNDQERAAKLKEIIMEFRGCLIEIRAETSTILNISHNFAGANGKTD